MKYIEKIIALILLSVLGIICVGCVDTNRTSEREVLRFHVRANSNLAEDQQVKLKVRDEVMLYLAQLTGDETTLEAAKSKIKSELDKIEQIAQKVLMANGFCYGVDVKINNEYFPTREYDGQVFESGYYDALIIELGSGTGDNWWCVIYPPLCYFGTGNFRYKSRIKEFFSTFR